MPRGTSRFVRAYLACAAATTGMLLRGELRLAGERVDRRLWFADGTCSRIYRETVRRHARTENPALLVVQFRLRVAGGSRVLHAMFRAESLLNTLLFAGFPGFRSKLWLTDLATGVYRGVYQWDGAGAATDYATTLVALLRRVSVPGSVHFHVEPGVRRDDFLRNPAAVVGAATAGDAAWWRLARGVAA